MSHPPRKKHLLAIHGAGMHGGVWGSLVAGLSLPCQAVSFPGHGRTEGAFLPSIETMAAWIGARLAEHPPHTVILLGHSMGALVALASAQHPAVAGLALLGAAARMPVHPELLHQAANDPDTAADMILKWGVSPVHPQAFAVRTVLREQMQAAAPGALYSDLKACNDWQGGAEAAKAVTQPALVIGGADDKLTRAAEGQALAGLMPQGQFHLMADSGHMLMVERPAETAQAINVFAEALGG